MDSEGRMQELGPGSFWIQTGHAFLYLLLVNVGFPCGLTGSTSTENVNDGQWLRSMMMDDDLAPTST